MTFRLALAVASILATVASAMEGSPASVASGAASVNGLAEGTGLGVSAGTGVGTLQRFLRARVATATVFVFDKEAVVKAAHIAASKVTTAKFPYHSTVIHGSNFAEAAAAHVKAKGGNDAEQAIAMFWGIFHDWGYQQAVIAQRVYGTTCVADIFASKTPGTLGLGTKLGENHEMYSISAATEAIHALPAGSPLKTVLEGPNALALGRLVCACVRARVCCMGAMHGVWL